MPKSEKALRVFVGASAKDEALVRIMAERLREAGFEPWTVAQEQRRGPAPKTTLHLVTRAVGSSDALVILLTPNSVRDPYTLVEYGAGMGSDRPGVMVWAGVSKDDIPLPLRGVRGVPFDQFDDAIRYLERDLALTA